MSVQPNKARLRTLLQGLKQNVDIGAESRLGMGGGHLNTVVLSGGGSTTLTAANSGATCVFDTAATSTFVLPAPELGMRFTFITTILATGDHVIQAATDGEGFIGGIISVSTTAAKSDSFSADAGGADDFITLDGATLGGAPGTRIEVVAILSASAVRCWAVSGQVACVGSSTADPFHTAQL